MRYPAEHKQETRERIVLAASRRFRRGGANVGIGRLMKSLKLTHGGFYRHFRSKDDLLAEAVARGFDDVLARVAAAVAKAPTGGQLAAVIESYLSEEHCADSAGGCPLASLAAEIGRQPLAVRAAFDRAARGVASAVAPWVGGKTEDERRRKAAVLLSGMSGTLALARALSDEGARKGILAAARRTYTEAFASP